MTGSITASTAFDRIKARIETASVPALTGGLKWQGEENELPESPEPFAYVEFITEPGSIAGFGGGQGANLYRNPGRVVIYVFVPRGVGLKASLDLAETLVATLRSFRDDALTVWSASALPGGDGASIKPEGLSSDVGNYFFSVGEADLSFDQVG